MLIQKVQLTYLVTCVLRSIPIGQSFLDQHRHLIQGKWLDSCTCEIGFRTQGHVWVYCEFINVKVLYICEGCFVLCSETYRKWCSERRNKKKHTHRKMYRQNTTWTLREREKKNKKAKAVCASSFQSHLRSDNNSSCKLPSVLPVHFPWFPKLVWSYLFASQILCRKQTHRKWRSLFLLNRWD